MVSLLDKNILWSYILNCLSKEKVVLPIRHTGCTLCCGLFSSPDTLSLIKLKYWNYLVHSSVILNSSCILQCKNEYEIQTCVATTTTAMPVDAGLESHCRGLPWDFFILPIVQPIHRLNNKYSICICETMSHPIENKRKMYTITTKIKFWVFFLYQREMFYIPTNQGWMLMPLYHLLILMS